VKTTKTLLVLTLTAFLAGGAVSLAAPSPQGMEKGAMGVDKGGEAKAEDPMARLTGFAGTWEVQLRSWPTPGGEPEVSHGTTVNEMVLDGKFLQMRYKGEFQGKSFVGMGFDSYDETRDKYVSVWLDSITPGFSTMEGDWDPATKTFIYYGKTVDPASGKMVDVKSIVTVRSSSMRTYQSFAKPSPDADWIKTMEIIFGKVK